MSILDRRSASRPRCDHCSHTAWAQTPDGLRCEEHTLSEVNSAIRQGTADWVPRILRTRRGGAHTA
ncbi:MAG TPA: hypothetical protein VJ938_08540 [Acidimicrobiia bacterium]|nr:hypothetical protein [Acidimicrobiia bacterium]